MDIKKTKIRMLGLLALVGGLFGVGHFVTAAIPCADEVCVGVPFGAKGVFNGTYFSRYMDIAVPIQDDASTGTEREIFMSTDGGTTWSPRADFYSLKKTDAIAAAPIGTSTTARFLRAPFNGDYIVTWIDKNPVEGDATSATGSYVEVEVKRPVSFSIKYQRYNFDGNPRGRVYTVATYNSESTIYKDSLDISYVGTDSNSLILISWRVLGFGPGTGIVGRYMSNNSDLTVLQPPVQVVDHKYTVLPIRMADNKAFITVPIEGTPNLLIIYPGRTPIPYSDALGDVDISLCKDYEAASSHNSNACSSYYASIITGRGTVVVPEFVLFPEFKYKDLGSVHATALKGVNAGKVLLSFTHVVRDVNMTLFGSTYQFAGTSNEPRSYIGRELYYKTIAADGTLTPAVKVDMPYPQNDPRLRTGEIPGRFYATRPSSIKGVAFIDGGFAHVFDISKVSGWRNEVDITSISDSEGVIPFNTFEHATELFYQRYTAQFFPVAPINHGFDVAGKIYEDAKFDVLNDDVNVAKDRISMIGRDHTSGVDILRTWPFFFSNFPFDNQGSGGIVNKEFYFKVAAVDNGLSIAFNTLLYKDTPFSIVKFTPYPGNISSTQCGTIACSYSGNNYISIDAFGNITLRQNDYEVFSDSSAETIFDEFLLNGSPVFDYAVQIKKGEIREFDYIGFDTFFINQAGTVTNYYDTISGEYIDEGRLSFVRLSNTDIKEKLYRDLKFTNDVSLQFKVVDRATKAEYLSPVKNLIYVPPTDGADGGINYTNGNTNNPVSTININMTCQICDVLQVYQRRANFTNGVCGSFGAWSQFGDTLITNVSRQVTQIDGCYQYKATASNTVLNIVNDYVSSNVIQVDTTAPFLTVSSDVVFDTATVNVTSSDFFIGAGVGTGTYQLNDQAPVNYDPNLSPTNLSLILNDGLNRLQVILTDLAGNTTQVDHFMTADLTPSAINVVGIDEGAVYASIPTLLYTTTQALTNVVITVDGVVQTDLNGLANGPHVLVITGVDSTGATIIKTINFVIDSTVFSLQVFSPQNKTYQTNNLTLDYSASKPVSNISYTLNGGAVQNNTNLQNLADGSYTMLVTATSQNGDTASSTINFDVSQAIPSLSVMSPLDNTIYTSKVVPLNIASDSDITLQLDGRAISANTGSLNFIKDGQHRLIVTATHPLSGNAISRVYNFSTDSIVPVVSLTSPEPRIYADSTIAINYKTNKVLTNIVYELDGNAVTSLSDLQIGLHNFRFTAQDQAGRLIDKTVSFEVATLDILTPLKNDQIISNDLPPKFDLQYQSQGNFTGYTVALDDQQQNLLSAAQGPGAVIPMITTPGNHELVLRGNINTQQLGKRVNFLVGAKNISVGADSINYVYTNCDQNFNGCDVAARLTIRNTGEFDVTTPFKVRLDHIDANGYESFWFDVPQLNKKSKMNLIVLPFKASLGDTLTVNVDPNSEIQNELADDNSYSLEFSAGKITKVEGLLSSKNVYFEGVSAFNVLAVATAGPVDKVEFRVNDWTFANNSTTGDFTTLVDMGLLKLTRPCIEIRALGSAGQILDIEFKCFKVSSLNINGLTKFTYDWKLHESAPNYVVVNDLDAAQMMRQSALLRLQVLSAPASIIAEVRDNGRVKYNFNYDPGTITNRVDEVVAKWGEDGFLNGNVALLNGQTVVASTIDPGAGVCNVDGAFALKAADRRTSLTELYAEELKNINDKATIFNLLSFKERIYLSLFNSFGAPYLWNIDLLKVEDVPGINLFGDSISDFRDSNAVADFLLGFFDIRISNIAWIRGDIPTDTLAKVKLNGDYINQYNGDFCILVEDGFRSIGLRMEGYYDWGLQNASINLKTNKIKIGILNYSYFSLGLPESPLGSGLSFVSHVPLLLTDIRFQIDAVNMNIPIDFGARLGIKINDNRLDEFGPFHTRFNLSIDHHQRLAKAEITVYPLFLPTTFLGFGGGVDYKLMLDMDAVAKFDLIVGAGFSDQFYKRVDYSASAKLFKRKKVCFLRACYRKGWKLNKVVFSRPNADEFIPFGDTYTQQDVDDYLQLINAPWLL